jgi:hypothetical protein
MASLGASGKATGVRRSQIWCTVKSVTEVRLDLVLRFPTTPGSSIVVAIPR